MVKKTITLLLGTLLSALSVLGQGPGSSGIYYQAADGKKGAELKTALFQVISPHIMLSYTPGVWNAINSYDLRPDGTVWDIYSAVARFRPVTDQDKGDDTVTDEGRVYNREHAMPKSWFNEGNDQSYPMYTDLHHLFPTDRIVNTMRSNYPYGEVRKDVKPTKQSAEGFSKFGICDPAIGYTRVNGQARVFEPNDEYKGDLARVYFYMATCYESYKTNGGKERSPRDWTSDMLTSDVYPFFTDWALRMLLRWAQQDPVSQKEIERNEAIFALQHNRNPYVDYPGLEQYVWGAYVNVAFSYDHYQPVETGIADVADGTRQPGGDAVYSLSGTRLKAGTRLSRGIYIRGGRKLQVK